MKVDCRYVSSPCSLHGSSIFRDAKQHLGVLSFWGQESGSRTQGGNFSPATITLAADKPNVLINALPLFQVPLYSNTTGCTSFEVMALSGSYRSLMVFKSKGIFRSMEVLTDLNILVFEVPYKSHIESVRGLCSSLKQDYSSLQIRTAPYSSSQLLQSYYSCEFFIQWLTS